MWNMFAQHGFVSLVDSVSQLIVSATKPSDTTKAWLQLDSLGRPVRLYWFAQGAWLSLHPQVPGQTILWTTALPTFTTFDGGDANALSALSGPMWEVDTDFAFAIPMGVGSNPVTYESMPATAIGVNQTLGEERHLLAGNEFIGPTHRHAVGKFVSENTGTSEDDGVFVTGISVPALAGIGTQITGDGASKITKDFSTLTGADIITNQVNDPQTIVSHQNLPPVRGVFFLRRTARIFYSIS